MKPFILTSILLSFAGAASAQESDMPLSPETVELITDTGLDANEFEFHPTPAIDCDDQETSYDLKILDNNINDAYYGRDLDNIMDILKKSYTSIPALITANTDDLNKKYYVIVDNSIYAMKTTTDNNHVMSQLLFGNNSFSSTFELATIGGRNVFSTDYDNEDLNLGIPVSRRCSPQI